MTRKDVYYAFKRIGTESIVAQYGSTTRHRRYGRVHGRRRLTKKGNEISGIEVPDDKTIVFHLTQPIGDFDHRRLPAAGPIPEEVAGCFTKAAIRPLRDLHGPYMIEGWISSTRQAARP